MYLSNACVITHERRKPLAACVAAVFALAAPTVYADTFVQNCNDTGPGSLRAAILAAPDGGRVNMTQLTTSSTNCSTSTITLRTGDLHASQNNLTIDGPASGRFRITGKYGIFPDITIEPYRILTHYGTGTLAISNLTLSNGYLTNAAAYASAKGGCIYSHGSVVLNNVGVYSCSANAPNGIAKGGGIYTKANLSLYASVVSGNLVDSGANDNAFGGGMFVYGALVSRYTTISDNTAASRNGVHNIGRGGGAVVSSAFASSTLAHTTVSGNTAGVRDGGLILGTYASNITITDSTISGNVAKTGIVGGALIYSMNTKIDNTTIAFNTAALSNLTNAVGLAVTGPSTGATLQLESTLISNNSYGVVADDLGVQNSITVSGHNNLIRASSADLPGDTIIGKCPLLGPLRNNGGVTLTHSLLSHSPAIDAGNSTYVSDFDQRGSPHARVSGSSADIGAYEVDQADTIFDANFDGCSSGPVIG